MFVPAVRYEASTSNVLYESELPLRPDAPYERFVSYPPSGVPSEATSSPFIYIITASSYLSVPIRSRFSGVLSSSKLVLKKNAGISVSSSPSMY